MTEAGRWLDSSYPWNDLVKTVGEEGAKNIWDDVSRQFASEASGEVNVFLNRMKNDPALLEKTYMDIEKPILIKNSNVTAINEYWDPLLPLP